MKYQVTRDQLQKSLDKFNYVCDRCGRKIVPIETVNNSGDPTYWAGCLHGGKSGGIFTPGVSKDVYKIAQKLVLEDSIDFGMRYEDKEYGLDYAWMEAVSRACSRVNHIEYIKNSKPRYTKKTLFQQHSR